MSNTASYFTIEVFNNNNMIFKADEVFGFGNFLECYEYENHEIYLYSYSDFYIEVSCTDKGNRIESILAITAAETIEKHLPKLDLESELKRIMD